MICVSSLDVDSSQRVPQVKLPVPCPRARIAEVGNLVLLGRY